MGLEISSGNMRRIMGFVMGNEVKFRVWICRRSIPVSSTWYRTICPWKKTCSCRTLLQWPPNAFLLQLRKGHTPLPSASPSGIHGSRDVLLRLWLVWHLARSVGASRVDPDGFVRHCRSAAYRQSVKILLGICQRVIKRCQRAE